MKQHWMEHGPPLDSLHPGTSGGKWREKHGKGIVEMTLADRNTKSTKRRYLSDPSKAFTNHSRTLYCSETYPLQVPPVSQSRFRPHLQPP